MYLFEFILVNFVLYFAVLIWYIVGIINTKVNIKSKSCMSILDVSIIVCVRNGEQSLRNLLNDFQKQKYLGNYEFIIVDDESTDSTKEIIQEFEKNNVKFKYISSNTGDSILSFKKKALDAGIRASSYNYLLFTDVDCRVDENWISSMMSNYDDDCDYVVGYSKIEKNNLSVSLFQSIDFKMMMFCSMGAISMNTPHGCSGQNQSYKKSMYLRNGGFSRISKLLQGDDSIFLQLSNNLGRIKTAFSLKKESHVVAKTHIKWSDFLKQRIRWAGDAQIMWKYNLVFYFAFIGFFISNMASLFFIYFLYYGHYLICYCIISKFFIELFLFFIGSKKIGDKFYLYQFCFWFLIHIPYVVLMGFLSPFISFFDWRGRKVQL